MKKVDNRESVTARLGLVFLLWSACLAVCGIFITFSVNHAPHIGLIGLIVVTGGATISRILALTTRVFVTRVSRWSNATAALASAVVCGLGAGALAVDATLGTFTLLVASWAAVVAVCDIQLSFDSTLVVVRRDFRVLALAGIALAIIEAAVPLSSVYAVGILGAYGIVASVYTAIAGVALRFDPTPASSEGKTTQ